MKENGTRGSLSRGRTRIIFPSAGHHLAVPAMCSTVLYVVFIPLLKHVDRAAAGGNDVHGLGINFHVRFNDTLLRLYKNRMLILSNTVLKLYLENYTAITINNTAVIIMSRPSCLGKHS